MNYLRALCCLALLLISAVTAAPASASNRTLSLVSLPGKAVAVHGTGWGRGRLVVSLQTGPWVLAVSLRPTAAGTFTVAAPGANLCAGVEFGTYDIHGHAKSVHGPPLGCASPADYPRPRLQVTSGTHAASPTVRIIAAHPASVTLHIGDVLYLWEPGTTAPFFNPRLSGTPAVLQLVAQGQTPAKTCAESDCAAGFYWKWLAVQTGDSDIDLSAACRQSKPPCMLPDFLIRVHVVS